MTSLNGLYKNIYWWYMATALVLAPAIFFPDQGITFFFSVFSSIILSSILLYKSIILFKKTPGKTPLPTLFLGILLVAGGGMLDMAVTVIFSPDLSEEENPVVLSLLNNNTPLWFIYLFMLFHQILSSSIHLFLWSCFLKTYPKIIKTIPSLNIFTTARWLMGCGKASFLDSLLGRNIEYYYLIPSLIFIMVTSNFIHWYAAMEWLKVIPIIIRIETLASCIVFISLLMLFFMTHFKVKRNHQYTLSKNFNNKINSGA